MGRTGSLKWARLSIHCRFIVSGKETRVGMAGAEARPTPLLSRIVCQGRLPGAWVTSPHFLSLEDQAQREQGRLQNTWT